jgi:NAD(P)-dependent dehydrogenase (short-subunit alcohol dehydrogenase family)
MSELDYRDRVAIVTGGAGGLGREYIRLLAQGGASVVLSDWPDPSGEAPGAKLAAEFRAAGLSVTFDPADIGTETDATGLVERIISKYGRLDILVNNAGNSADGPVQAHTTQMFESLMDVHLYGTFWTMKVAIPQMRKQGYGRIVNAGSNFGAFAAPKLAAFCAAKAAVIALTKVAALENLDVDIGINAIAPSADTASGFLDRFPSIDRTMFSAEEVAPMVAFLCHQRCRLTGEVMSSMGGRHARIWVSTAPGYFKPGASPADIEANLDKILSLDSALIPHGVLDELALVVV